MSHIEHFFTVEFFHPYFGWLEYEREFDTYSEARQWLNANPSPYKQRIRHRHAVA